MMPFAPLLPAPWRGPPRRPAPPPGQGRRYPLAHLPLSSVALAVLAGATSHRGSVTFLAVHRDRLG